MPRETEAATVTEQQVDRDHDGPFAVTLRSTSEAVRRTLALITEHFAGSVPDAELGMLEMVLAETLNNVVEHAMSGNARGQVKLRILCRNGGLDCTILDNGLPMPDGEPPRTTLPEIGRMIDDLPEGGFGWSLIRMHVRDLEYRRQDGINVLRFLLPLTEMADT